MLKDQTVPSCEPGAKDLEFIDAMVRWPRPVWILDGQGTCLWLNDNAANLLGLTPGEVIGTSLSDGFRARKFPETLLPNVIRGDKVKVRIGTWYYEFLAEPVGQNKILVWAQDVTQKQLLSTSLQDLQQKYQALLDSISEGVIVYRDWRIVTANRQASTALGARAPNDLLGRRLSRFIAPASRDDFYRHVRDGDVPVPFEYQIICLDGRLAKVVVTSLRRAQGWSQVLFSARVTEEESIELDPSHLDITSEILDQHQAFLRTRFDRLLQHMHPGLLGPIVLTLEFCGVVQPKQWAQVRELVAWGAVGLWSSNLLVALVSYVDSCDELKRLCADIEHRLGDDIKINWEIPSCHDSLDSAIERARARYRPVDRIISNGVSGQREPMTFWEDCYDVYQGKIVAKRLIASPITDLSYPPKKVTLPKIRCQGQRIWLPAELFREEESLQRQVDGEIDGAGIIFQATTVGDFESQFAVLARSLNHCNIAVGIEFHTFNETILRYLSKVPVDTILIPSQEVLSAQHDTAAYVTVQAVIWAAGNSGIQLWATGVKLVEQIADLRRLGFHLVSGNGLQSSLS